jgi:hypothetical protein
VFQALHRLVLADRTRFEVPQHRVQLIKLQLLQVEITQEVNAPPPKGGGFGGTTKVGDCG